jgi:hypothetical protein
MVLMREPVPSDSRLIKDSASLSCLWFVQGSLFPLLFIQQACLASVLVKGLYSLFPVLLVSSAFLIYNILTFDQKKEKKKELSERNSI